ncbi:MAG TPA: ATP-binding protein [Vitreimonas sp.]|uniref:ATP-binding protein n=1 Tax=Vitreimonas sp. TaxID=3069702 RepID=UPI002D5AE916|nr:ATP-binding protein [Vitreimonas sp.]HYD87653.1 ATP-binding protein [Vitreimonas sp.]
MADEHKPDSNPDSTDVAALLNSLRLSEARLRGVLNSISDGFYAVDRSWRFTEFNPAAETYFRIKRDDIIGRVIWDMIPGASDEFKHLLRAAMAGAPMATLETPSLYRPDRFVELRIAPTEEGICVALTDITERKRASEEVQRRLDAAVAERTAALEARLQAEAQLRQAQKLEAVGQLTGGVAHDFNNLLMIIAGGLNMLERSDAPGRREMLMARMREAVERGANLTRQLLAFSRRHELNPEPIRLGDYFAGLNDLLGRSLGVNVRVVIDAPAEVAPILADRNGLQLAILNLTVNARDAMNDSGVVTICARDGALDDPGAPFVSISVMDTGAGMTPDVIARIFEPFFTTKEIGKGSGLGLAQVHGFAEQSGGRIHVFSTPGQGTSMTLVLPRAETAPAAAPSAAAPPRAPSSPRGAVLLVEDDQEVAAITQEMLQDIGWRVTRVASAEAALGALNRARFDLVFSDVMMPGGMSGVELVRELRAGASVTPVVLTTGYSESVRAEAERLSVALLPKPYDVDSLARALDAAMAASV